MIFACTIPTSMLRKFPVYINWVVSVLHLISSLLQYPVNTPRRLIFSFRKGTAIAPSAVTGFTESDLTVTNGEIVSGSFTSVSDGNYTFKVRSNPWPGS